MNIEQKEAIKAYISAKIQNEAADKSVTEMQEIRTKAWNKECEARTHLRKCFEIDVFGDAEVIIEMAMKSINE